MRCGSHAYSSGRYTYATGDAKCIAAVSRQSARAIVVSDPIGPEAGDAPSRYRPARDSARPMPRQPQFEMAPHVRPLLRQDAVEYAVPHRAVATKLMPPDHTILVRPQSFDGALRREVEAVGPQRHHAAVQIVECVREQEQLARAVDVAALPARGVPGVADFHTVNHSRHVVIARGTHYGPRAQFAHRPGQH